MLDDQRPRRVVPRWRSSWIAATTAESKSVSVPRVSAESKRTALLEVARKSDELRTLRSVPVAAELMFLASTTGDSETALHAARMILDEQGKIGNTQLFRAAQKIAIGSIEAPEHGRSRDLVRRARELLAIDYRNPILLIDVARELTSMRHNNTALRYVRTAVALAPSSRFVMRAAARFYLHIGENDIAHDLLRRSPLLKFDPWIQASEIAVATVRGRTSTLAKPLIRSFYESKGIRADQTELVSALGTVELLSGSEKKAKALFRHSLSAPNDNSLAQAEWAAPRLKLLVDSRALQTPMSYEANSRHAYRELQIDDAIRFADEWAKDESFGSRPFDTLCYLLSLDGRYREALIAANKAYELDGDDLGLALNLVFSKTQAGDVEDAMQDFLRLGRHPQIRTYATHYLANGGALAYASGDFVHARELYQRAIRSSKAQGDAYLEALAWAYFARIATQFGDPLAPSIVADATAAVPRLPSPGAIYVVQGLVDEPKKKKLLDAATSRLPRQKWHWDAVSNTLRLLEP